MATRIQRVQDASIPAQTPEVRVKNYLEVFQKAIQSQIRPEYNPSDLQDLQSKVAKDNKTSYETREDLELVLWMEHSLKNSDYVKASFINGRPNLEILPEALELDFSEFVKMIEPLTSKFKCSVVVEGKNYTSSAISMFLAFIKSTKGAYKPELLSPGTTYTLKLKDGRSRECTRAEMFFFRTRQISKPESPSTLASQRIHSRRKML